MTYVSQQKQIIAKKVNSFIIRAFLHYNKKKRPCFIAMMNRGLFSMLFSLKGGGKSHLYLGLTFEHKGLAKVTCKHKLIMDMSEQKWLVFTSENISIVIPNEFMKMLEKAWKIKEKWAFLWNGNGMKKVIYKYKWWWKMTYIYDWEFIENHEKWMMKNHL